MSPQARPELFEFVYLAAYERFARAEIPDAVERAFETMVLANRQVGAVMPVMGGVRKVRVALPGVGKRGGARFLYLVRFARGRVYVVTAYAKSMQADLSPQQRKRIRQIVSDLE